MFAALSLLFVGIGTDVLLAATEGQNDAEKGTGSPRQIISKMNSGSIGPTVFVIEAEDFDYDAGQSNPRRGEAGLDINVMPYLGGAYQDIGAIEDIDFVNADGPESDFYRTETGNDGDHEVNIADNQSAPPGNGAGGTIPIAGNDRIAYATATNFRIGWAGDGDWQNYTRVFPTNNSGGWWKVYAALSHGDAAATMSGRLERVTAGAGTADQAVESLGTFSAPASGAWGNNNLVLMKTATGADAIVKLRGTNTVRFNNGSGDFDFLLFTPAPSPPPFVSRSPVDSVEPTNAVLTFTIQDTDLAVRTNSVRLFVDGADVTSSVAISRTGSVTYVSATLAGPLTVGERAWRLTFADNRTPPVTTAAQGTFTVVPFSAPGIFAIEAEDFNYSAEGVTGGLWNPQRNTPNMDVDKAPYHGGAYATLAAVEGVDYNNDDGDDSDLYRTELDVGGQNEVNITASNGNRYSNTRGAYDLTSNYRIGWAGAGDWQNYTRTFPSNTYNVWAALSYGGEGPDLLSGSLDLVTSNPAAANQTVERLGTFSGPGTGGWGRNELLLMKGTNGEPASITLNGVQTVRFNLGSGDFDYLLFVPPAPPRITSVTRNENGSLTITWIGGGQLETASSLSSPWSPVTGATTGSHTFVPAGRQPILFLRIRR